MRQKPIIWAVQATLIGIVLVCFIMGWKAVKQNETDTAKYSETVRVYTTQTDTRSAEHTEKEKPVVIGADFAALRAQNEEISAWLYIPDTDINYPIVQGKDNTKYLSTGWDGAYARAGAAFFDARQDLSQSRNYIVYGHSMSSSSSIMFFQLLGYRDADYCAAHPYFYMSFADDPIGKTQHLDEVKQPDGQYRFQVIAVCKVDTSHEEEINRFYWFDYDGDELLEDYLQTLKNNSLQELKIEGTPYKFVTLSTCANPGMGGNEKLIIVGALYEETLKEIKTEATTDDTLHS